MPNKSVRSRSSHIDATQHNMKDKATPIPWGAEAGTETGVAAGTKPPMLEALLTKELVKPGKQERSAHHPASGDNQNKL